MTYETRRPQRKPRTGGFHLPTWYTSVSGYIMTCSSDPKRDRVPVFRRDADIFSSTGVQDISGRMVSVFSTEIS